MFKKVLFPLLAFVFLFQTLVSASSFQLETMSTVDPSILPNFNSNNPAISGDARYVGFISSATNLINNDTNNAWDVFLFDRIRKQLERISISSDEAESNGDSDQPVSISNDGRYVVFASVATNLVPGDTNNKRDIFLRDRQLGTTERISVSSDEDQSNGDSYEASISANGRYVVFYSTASNLVPGDTSSRWDIFIRDLQTGSTERVSVNSTGGESSGSSFSPSISADGRYVVFASDASDLVTGDTNSRVDVFIRDLQTGTTERISVDSSGGESNGFSSPGGVSADGRYVVFQSDATNLVPGDTNNKRDIFLRDRQMGITKRISVDSTGGESNGDSNVPAPISSDGRYVVFTSNATNLVTDDTNNAIDVFLYDTQLETVRALSVSSNGIIGNGISLFPAISSDGLAYVFSSNATNLTENDTSNSRDIFFVDTSPRVDPVISPISISSNNSQSSVAKEGDTVVLEWTMDTQPAILEVVLNNQIVSPVCVGSVPVSCSASFVVTDLVPQNDGLVEFSIKATARGGVTDSINTTDNSSVTVDRSAPTLAVISVGGDDNSPFIINTNNPAIIFNASQGDIVSSPSLQCPITPNQGDSITCFLLQNLERYGRYEYTANISDKAGNIGQGSFWFVYNPRTVIIPTVVSQGTQGVAPVSTQISPSVDSNTQNNNSESNISVSVQGNRAGIVAVVSPITRNVFPGQKGEVVRNIQAILNQEGFIVSQQGPGSPGNETTVFGPATRRAVRNFQSSNGIPQTGNVGPLTRVKINSLIKSE